MYNLIIELFYAQLVFAKHAGGNFICANFIKVISFNIKLAKNIEHSIYELKYYPELKYADLILLKEMDEIGTDKIAKILKYNYIYYPASIHPKSDRNFGNAILSKWSIINDQKIILPHKVAICKTRRITVSAAVLMDKLKLRVYSVHTETMVLNKEKRMNQAKSV